eukprot:CAMPEP_0202029118 /NCGR_PEP_ID=MMETSP0905-20130828/63809_1 /ASSEMBLY_ACC=CAM_ASM_000554 /TAXON_ID=420261 /ORGANISM="Thalassiosira antarctica, Strain CCMP982" /LENGTH=289 /DNA_ID=CAMNT_0048592859 /DNA_START=161 /DNA_END=1030 /DNA_ORIENTATION=-
MSSTSKQYAEPQDEPSNKSRNIGSCVFTCTLLGIAGFLTWKYALDEPQNWTETKEGLGELFDAAADQWDEWDLGNFSNVLDDLDDFSFGDLFDEDPKQGDNSTLSWKSDFVQPNNGGLHLTLQNALDDTWQQEFAVAVKDWQESDSLVLSTTQVAVDHTCNRVDGVMLVCNGNFGATGWVGINENSIMRGVIVSSVAKMNEYYLRNANFDHRRFTMCHELGHGFGLPHTDENPYNTNLGDCLDYTDDPEENLNPGEINMAKLRKMYLSRRLRRVESDGTVVETTELLAR